MSIVTRGTGALSRVPQPRKILLTMALVVASIINANAPSAQGQTGAAGALAEAPPEGPPPGMAQAQPVDTPSVGTLTRSFPWGASLKYRLPSRVWHQNAGNTTIYSNMNCSSDPNISGYVIQLSDREAVWYRCNRWYVYTWRGVPAGNKQFVITKANDGRYIHGTGRTYYP
jgi:hypothetical protein